MGKKTQQTELRSKLGVSKLFFCCTALTIGTFRCGRLGNFYQRSCTEEWIHLWILWWGKDGEHWMWAQLVKFCIARAWPWDAIVCNLVSRSDRAMGLSVTDCNVLSQAQIPGATQLKCHKNFETDSCEKERLECPFYFGWNFSYTCFEFGGKSFSIVLKVGAFAKL